MTEARINDKGEMTEGQKTKVQSVEGIKYLLKSPGHQ